jgi:hypothetical protein
MIGWLVEKHLLVPVSPLQWISVICVPSAKVKQITVNVIKTNPRLSAVAPVDIGVFYGEDYE